tara:strand:- start:211 stop:459 length:249 start_codon:yes stop_codon:yes gene_type:complete
MLEVAKGLAVLALLAAFWAIQPPYPKKRESLVIALFLPYLFASIAVVLGFVVRPDEAVFGFLLFPFVGLLHLLYFIKNRIEK